jgi:ketosteroid isomerase-like protein
VEIVRQNYDAFDGGRYDLALEGWDPEGEFIPAMAGAVEDKIYRGHEGFRRYFDELFASFSEVRLDNREYKDLGDRVLVLYRLRVRGRDSGVEIDQPGGAVYQFRDGRIVLGRSFLSQSEALEAVGLRA